MKIIFLFMFFYQKFKKAAEEVKELSAPASDADLLELYSLYKQATIGDCNTCKYYMRVCKTI